MERSLRGLCVLLSAVAVNSQWLFPRGSSCFPLSPWREFPMIPLRTAFDWPLQLKPHPWSMLSSIDDDAWWVYDQRRPSISHDSFSLCPTHKEGAAHRQSQQQQNDKSECHQTHSCSAKRCTDRNVHQHSSKLHAPIKPPLEHQKPMKLQTGSHSRQATIEPQKASSPNRQATMEPEKASPGRQARRQPQKGFHNPKATMKPQQASPSHKATMEPEKGFSRRQAKMEHQKASPSHEATMEPQKTFGRSQATQADTKPELKRKLDNSEMEEVLSIPLLGFSPRELKITHHGNHIRVSASRTCSSNDGCVSREMEKTYELPIAIAKGSMKASVDEDVKHVLIRGLPIEPSEETQMNSDDGQDPNLTGYTDETEEILAEDVD